MKGHMPTRPKPAVHMRMVNCVLHKFCPNIRQEASTVVHASLVQAPRRVCCRTQLILPAVDGVRLVISMLGAFAAAAILNGRCTCTNSCCTVLAVGTAVCIVQQALL
jgi:hypothetical protein